MNKKDIAKVLDEISIFYELKDENFFKIRAYQMAARALEVSDIEIIRGKTTLEELQSVKGIGAGIAKQVLELLETSKLKLYDGLKRDIPPGLVEMLKIPKLGPKKIKYLYGSLDIKSIAELEYACLENKLLKLENFGPKTQENILKGIEFFSRHKDRFLYADVIEEAKLIEDKLKNFKAVNQCSIAGSLRRKKEIIKDIDIVASSQSPDDVMEFFVSLEEVTEVIAKGDTKSSVRLASGINADLRVVSDLQYPYALHHFTGSKEHNTAIRSMAKKYEMKMNEYGLFKGEENIDCSSEKDIFAVFGMEYIEPELRENTGEIEAALNNSLPELIKEEDIKGIFHFHTTSSDGTMSLARVVEELKKIGFSYCGVADHSRTAFYAGGIKDENIAGYLEEIDNINRQNPGFKVFKGIESDILPDGSLDYSEDILEKFDFVIIAIHSNFNMSEKQMTGRIIRGMQNRYATILAHPTGRLLLSRDPYNVNIIEIIDAASELDVALEINASPFRLDLDWQYCKYAKEKRVKMFINPDAHSVEGLYDYKYGVNVARKGWLEKSDIANTMETDLIEEYFLRKRMNK
jgi:DNA polymerase (family 10)